MAPRPFMSNRKGRTLRLADALALRVQELRSRGFVNETATLLSLDYASQAAQAPYLFDMADGILHRGRCAAIPNGSKSTLYAVWELKEGDAKLACPICCSDQPRSPTSRPKARQTSFSASYLSWINSTQSFGNAENSVASRNGKGPRF